METSLALQQHRALGHLSCAPKREPNLAVWGFPAAGPRSTLAALRTHGTMYVNVVCPLHGHPTSALLSMALMHDRRYVPMVLTPFR